MSQIVAVCGAGAAGVFCAVVLKERSPTTRVILCEATQKPLQKVLRSGGGRCNVTHAEFDPKRLVTHYPRGERELRQAFSRFQPSDTIQWFENHGVNLVTEADGRMFPSTHRSETIKDTLMNLCHKLGVEVRTGCKITSLVPKAQGYCLRTKGGEDILADQVVLATGSAPIGYELARALGHKIIDPIPSIFTFVVKSRLLTGLSGLSFPSASVKLQASRSYEAHGPLLITHWGLSGPAILRLSAFAARDLYANDYVAKLTVNWLGLPYKSILSTLRTIKTIDPRRLIGMKPPVEVPTRFWVQFLNCMGLPFCPFGALKNATLAQIAQALYACPLEIDGRGMFKEEFVTAGGVCRDDIDFRTMASRVARGIYVVGELCDVDGVTGGFNFQNAWTTGYLAATALAENASTQGSKDLPKESPITKSSNPPLEAHQLGSL